MSATPSLPPVIDCPNCGTRHGGNYCPHCGQDARVRLPTVRKFLVELIEKYLGVEGRLPLTLRQLFLHPGAMTADYLAGRRQRYVSPLRLYLAVSLLFFLGLMQVPGLSVVIARTGVEINTEAVADLRLEANTGIAAIDARVAAFARLDAEARNRLLRQGIVREAPKAMLLLIPLFAALLWLLYRGRYYGEHLLTALHFHSFAFVLLLPGLVPWPARVHGPINDAINLLLAGYLFVMLRRVYGGGLLVTGLRLGIVIAVYVLSIAATAVAGVVLALEH